MTKTDGCQYKVQVEEVVYCDVCGTRLELGEWYRWFFFATWLTYSVCDRCDCPNIREILNEAKGEYTSMAFQYRCQLRILKDHYFNPRPISEWCEEYGPCIWYRFPIEEPPYCGTPLDDDFIYYDDDKPYYTHWTPLPDANEVQKRYEKINGIQSEDSIK